MKCNWLKESAHNELINAAAEGINYGNALSLSTSDAFRSTMHSLAVK